MFDHRYFPHLIDVIFQHAPPESLFVMMRVSRQWRKAALHGFQHLSDFTASRSKAAPAVLQVQFRIGPNGPYFTKDTETEQQRLPSVQVLDVGHSAALSTFYMPSLHTLRFSSKPRSGRHIPLSVTRVVLNNLYPTYFLHNSCVQVFVIIQRDGFHFPRPRRSVSFSASGAFPFTVTKVVYIFLGTPPHAPPNDPPASYLSDVAKLSEGFEAMHKRMCSGNFLLIGVNIPDPVVAYVASRAPVNWRTRNGNEVVALRSLEEYRQDIGEKEFAIETDMTSRLAL